MGMQLYITPTLNRPSYQTLISIYRALRTLNKQYDVYANKFKYMFPVKFVLLTGLVRTTSSHDFNSFHMHNAANRQLKNKLYKVFKVPHVCVKVHLKVRGLINDI